MLRSRFEVFTALSLALHAGIFGVMVVRRGHSPPPGAGAADGTVGAGAAAVPGETFEVPEMEPTADESAGGAEAAPIELDSPAAQPPTTNGESPTAAIRTARRSRGRPSPAAGEAQSAPPPLYGAVGDRVAGDLLTTFKSLFSSAASTDPVWDHVPIGFYADGNVTFFLAEDGTLTRTTISASAAPAFRAAVLRTNQLLKHRLFTARGATTRVHMIVRVSDHLVNHGAFTITSSPWFELPSGRHVDLSIVEK